MTNEPVDHIVQFFAYEHLPPALQGVSRPFCELARALVEAETGVAWPGDAGVVVSIFHMLRDAPAEAAQKDRAA